jgi:hypothetical protein
MRRIAAQPPPSAGNRIRISNGCAAVGVLMLVLAGAMPETWYPVVPLVLGIGLLVVSHWLTPCQDQITQWWRRKIRRFQP